MGHRGGQGAWKGALGWRTLTLAASLSLAPAIASAHGSAPKVVDILFPPQDPRLVWAITDVQGLFGDVDGQRRWLCEDAVVPFSGFLGLAPVDDALRRWVVATTEGLFATEDAGCHFAPLFQESGPSGVLRHSTNLSAHPTRPAELLVGTAALDGDNDLFLSEDGGRTWREVGLGAAVRGMLRADAAPERVYVLHAAGLSRSEDGGRTWEGVSLAGSLGEHHEALTLLATHPDLPLTVFMHLDQLPEAHLLRSDDAGDTWRVVLALDGPAISLGFADGQRAILSSVFDGQFHSEDGGETWARDAARAVRWLGCLRRQPGTNRLWGCSDIFQGGPWILAYTEDAGDRWQPTMESLVDVASGWHCPVDSMAFRECNRYCGGSLSGGVCERIDAGVPPLDAGPDLDAGVPDGMVGRADAGVAGDAGRDAGDAGEDSGVTPAPRRGGGGCSVGAMRFGNGATGVLAFLLMTLVGVRRAAGSSR